VVVALVALVRDVCVIVGLAAVPKGPEIVIEAAPSAKLEMLMGTTLDVEVNAPELSKFSVPDPTVVGVPVAPVISADGTVTV
jgi:hypothetical protein